ncbi:MAG TPA: FAD-dependent oxidoreductase [Candidatus Lokiarchaeia archaeon]|nr:FAD-dependent oxidoreductase [Candidatus Lokiarchaeia archaeon]
MSQEYVTEPEKQVPVLRDIDILVVGGSQAGVAAAVAARRANNAAKVMLVEQNGFLGGQSVGGMVVHWEFREYTNNKGQIIGRGIGKEMIRRIVENGNSDPLFREWLDGKGPPFMDVPDQRAHADIPLDVNDIQLVLGEMLEEAGVEVLLNSKVVGALPLDESSGFPASRGAFVETINGKYAIKSKIIVDCSAFADMAWHIGGNDAIIVPETQAMGMQAYAWVDGVDLEKFVKEGIWGHTFQILYPKDEQQLWEHVQQGKTFIVRGFADTIEEAFEKEPELLEIFEKTGATPNIYLWLKPVRTRKVEIDGKIKYIGNIAIEGPSFQWKQVDPFLVSKAEINQIPGVCVQTRIHKYLPGWENAFLDRTVTKIGFRQTRIPIGMYALTKTDVVGHAKFPDVIGRNTGHDVGRGNFEAEYGYDIPYRVLVPAKIDGLLFGARAVSTEDDTSDPSLTALNAHRGIMSTIVVSQASGVAAALCIKNGVEPRNIDMQELQAELVQQDVVLETPQE